MTSTLPEGLELLASEYYDFRQRTWPTWAHLQGEYRYADRFEDVTRDAEDRQIVEARSFARRAEQIAEDGLDREQRITREMLAWDATARSDFAESRLAELDVDPIFGPQAMLQVTLPKLGIPSAEVAEAMVGKMQGIGRMFRDLGERHREGAARGRTPARFAVDATVAQLDAWLAGPVDDDPLLALAAPNEMPDAAAWRSRNLLPAPPATDDSQSGSAPCGRRSAILACSVFTPFHSSCSSRKATSNDVHSSHSASREPMP